MPELLPNPGIETGTTTGFTTTAYSLSAATDGAYYTPHGGTYSLGTRIVTPNISYPASSQHNYYYIRTDLISVEPGQPINWSLWIRLARDARDTGCWFGAADYVINLKWYDASQALQSTDQVYASGTVQPDATWRQRSGATTVPADRYYLMVEIKQHLQTGASEAYTNVNMEWWVETDDWSVTTPGSTGGIIWF